MFAYQFLGLIFIILSISSNDPIKLYQGIFNPITFNKISNYSIGQETMVSKYDIAGNYGKLNINFSITNIMGSSKFVASSYDVINLFNDFGSVNRLNLCTINQDDLSINYMFSTMGTIISNFIHDFFIMNNTIFLAFYNYSNFLINIIYYNFENMESINEQSYQTFSINEKFKENLQGIIANQEYIIIYNASAFLIYNSTTNWTSNNQNEPQILGNKSISFVKKVGINGNLIVIVFKSTEFWIFNSTTNVTGNIYMFDEITNINDIELFNNQFIISTNTGLYITEPFLSQSTNLNLQKKILDIFSTNILAINGNTLILSISPLINQKNVFAYEYSLEIMNITREFSLISNDTPIQIVMDKDYTYFQMNNSNSVLVIKHSLPNIFTTVPYVSQIIGSLKPIIFLPIIKNKTTNEINHLIGYSNVNSNHFNEVQYHQNSQIVCDGSKFNEFSEGKYNIEIRRFSLECSKKDLDKNKGKLLYLCYDSKILQLFKNEGESLLNQTFVLSFILLFLVCLLLLSIIIYVIRNRKKEQIIEEQNQKIPIEYLHKEDKIVYSSLLNNIGEDSEVPYDMNNMKDKRNSAEKVEEENILKNEKDN